MMACFWPIVSITMVRGQTLRKAVKPWFNSSKAIGDEYLEQLGQASSNALVP
jgi:hypothetical protein